MQHFKLGDIVKVVAGTAIPATRIFDGEGISFINRNNWESLKNLWQLPKIQPNNDLTKVPAGAILIYPAQDAYHICQQELYIGEQIIAIIPNESIILSEYLFYFLQAQSLKVEEVEQQTIELPRIETQQEIIAYLVRWQAISEQIQNILTALPQLEQYMLTENLYLRQLQIEQQALTEQFNWMDDIHKILLSTMRKQGAIQ